MRVVLAVLLMLVVVQGCAPRADRTRAPLTERQRDSVLAQSPLPGASVVGRALDVSDKAAGRAEGMAAADSLFH